MYLSHFGLDEPPFRITPNTEFFYDGANRGAMLDALLYAITHDEGIVKVSGEVGSGKTMLCRVLISRLPKNVETIFLANPSLSREEILHAIAEDLHVELTGQRTTLLLRALQEHLIKRYAQGQRVVVLIDEAHAMPAESLEEIRLLSNLESSRHKLLQIVLFGQPELDEHLNRPDMRQLNERITHSFKLDPLQRSDVGSYVDFRLRAAGYRGPRVFSDSALRLIASASQGLTRRVNILADKSLLAAFSDNSTQVLLKHTRAAVKDSGFRRIGRTFHPWWLAAGGVVAGLAIGAAIQFLPAWAWISNAVGISLSRVESNNVRGVESSARTIDSAPPTAQTADSPTTQKQAAPAPVPPTKLGDTGVEVSPRAASTEAPTPSTDATTVPTSPPSTDSNSPDASPNKEPQSIQANAMTPAPVENVTSSTAHDDWTIRGVLTQRRHVATKRWLAQTPSNRFSIQLLTANEVDAQGMEGFLQRAAELVSADDLYVFSWKNNGRVSYRVTYGTFESQQASLATIARLPAPLKTYRPFPESVESLRKLSATP